MVSIFEPTRAIVINNVIIKTPNMVTILVATYLFMLNTLKAWNYFITLGVFPQFNYLAIYSNFRKTCPLIEKEKCLPQNAVTVEMNVKFHSNQKMTDLFIAENASKITSQLQDLAVDSVEDLVVMVEMIEVPDLVGEMTGHEKYLMQNAVTVEMIVKYHSNQKMTDLFIAENVSKITNKTKKSF
jgi:ribosome-associated toxin RatA of RatAB toxin-antitoxin module